MSLHPRHLAPAILGLLCALGGCSTTPTEDPRIAALRHANAVAVIRPFEAPVADEAPKFDVITLILNSHANAYLPLDRAKMNQRLLAALKPGGHFVVIDHSAKAGADISVGKNVH